MLGYRRQLDSLEQLKTYLEMLHLFPSPSCPQGFSPFFPVGAEAGKEAKLMRRLPLLLLFVREPSDPDFNYSPGLFPV